VSDTFGAAALGLYGVAARLLGWRPREFWGATPAELVAALTPPGGGSGTVDRSTLEQMMEHEHG
jgi:Phage tail assembly chaperone protein, TAC